MILWLWSPQRSFIVVYEAPDGEANYSPWVVTLNGVFYPDTTLDREKIDALKDGGRYVVVIERYAGYMECLGIDVASGTVSDPEGGLQWAGGNGGSGIMKTDDVSFKIALKGNRWNFTSSNNLYGNHCNLILK